MRYIAKTVAGMPATDGAGVKLTRELTRRRSQTRVGPTRNPHSRLVRHSRLLAMCTTVIEKAK